MNILYIFLCRLNVDIESSIQILPVATHLPSGYLSIQPLGLGKGVRVKSILFRIIFVDSRQFKTSNKFSYIIITILVRVVSGLRRYYCV